MRFLDAQRAWTQLAFTIGLIALALAVGCGGGAPVSTDSEFEPFQSGEPKRKAQVTLAGVDLAELVESRESPRTAAFSKIRATVKLCESDGSCSERKYEIQYGRGRRSLKFQPISDASALWTGDLSFLLGEIGTDPTQFRETLSGRLEVRVTESSDSYTLVVSGIVFLSRDRDSRDGRSVESKMTPDSGRIPVRWETTVDKPSQSEDCSRPCSLDAYGRIPRGA